MEEEGWEEMIPWSVCIPGGWEDHDTRHGFGGLGLYYSISVGARGLKESLLDDRKTDVISCISRRYPM